MPFSYFKHLIHYFNKMILRQRKKSQENILPVTRSDRGFWASRMDNCISLSWVFIFIGALFFLFSVYTLFRNGQFRSVTCNNDGCLFQIKSLSDSVEQLIPREYVIKAEVGRLDEDGLYMGKAFETNKRNKRRSVPRSSGYTLGVILKPSGLDVPKDLFEFLEDKTLLFKVSSTSMVKRFADTQRNSLDLYIQQQSNDYSITQGRKMDISVDSIMYLLIGVIIMATAVCNGQFSQGTTKHYNEENGVTNKQADYDDD